MNDVRLLEKRFGGWWCGVKFGRNAGVKARQPVHPMRFCEAVVRSRTGPITLTSEFVNCPGASRCLGWDSDEKALGKAIATKAGIQPAVAHEVLRNTPRLEDELGEVIVGTYEEPDVVVSYSQPVAVMRFLREWQRSHGGALTVEASGFMSVCGAVAVKAYVTGSICISFGCPDAREHGSIGRDRLVVGLPMCEVSEIARSLRAAKAVRSPKDVRERKPLEA